MKRLFPTHKISNDETVKCSYCGNTDVAVPPGEALIALHHSLGCVLFALMSPLLTYPVERHWFSQVHLMTV